MFETLKNLPEPIKTTHKFIGGPLDGQTKEATVYKVLTDKVIVTIDGASYKYIGDDTFNFIGIQTSSPDPVLTPMQKVKAAFIKWLFT